MAETQTMTRAEIKAASTLVLTEVPQDHIEYAIALWKQLDGGPEATCHGCLMSALEPFYAFERDEIAAEIERRKN